MIESMVFHEIMAYIYLPVILIGILGNTLSFYAYRRPNRKSMVAFLLFSLSVSEVFLLLFALPLFSVMYLPIWNDNEKQYIVAYTAKYVYPLCMMAKTCSLYIMVLITIERWVAVCRPLEVQIWSFYTTSTKTMFCVITFAVVLNFPRFFEFEIDFINDELIFRRELLDSEKHWWYFMFYFIVVSIIFDYMLPFSIMFISNTRIIKELRRTKKERSLMTIQQQKEQNTTFMLLVVTIFFGFCHFFSMALKIAESFAGGFLTIENIYLEMLGEVFNFLIILHTASTFFIYFIFSERFRIVVQGIWDKNKKAQRCSSTVTRQYSEKRGSIIQTTVSPNTKYTRISTN